MNMKNKIKLSICALLLLMTSIANAQSTISVKCEDGTFENGLFSPNYSGGSLPAVYNADMNGCSLIGPNNIGTVNNTLGTLGDIAISNNVPDPIVPGLNQTNNGSMHAVRINEEACTSVWQSNKLTKSFAATQTGMQSISFSYAVVFEHVNSTTNPRYPYFVARIMDDFGKARLER